MKKISILFSLALAALGFSACNETWDDNPTLRTHEGEPVVNILNRPEMQDMPIVLGTENANGSLHLTCSQPDYGFAAAATYAVQVSLSADFAKFFELATTFGDCAEINPVCGEVAEAVCKSLDVKSVSDLPTTYYPVYFRLRVYLTPNGLSDEIPNTEYLSNVVAFNKINVNYLAMTVPDQPTGIYLRGGFNNWGNDGLTAADEFVTTSEKGVYVIKHIEMAPCEFKVADANWGAVNLGASSFAVGQSVALEDGGPNIVLDVPFSGKVTLTTARGKYSILFTPAQ